MLKPLLPDTVITLLSASEAAKPIFRPHALYIAKNFTGRANEKQFMGCWRLQYQGARSVVLARFHELHACVQAAGHKDIDYQHVWTFLHKATFDQTAAIAKAATLWHGSVGPREVLYLPYGLVAS